MLRCRVGQTLFVVGTFLEVEPEADVDTGAIAVRVDRTNPGSWCDHDPPANRCVNRNVGPVVRTVVTIWTVGLFDRLVVALAVSLVVRLLLLVGMVMVIAVGMSGWAQANSCNGNKKCCSA